MAFVDFLRSQQLKRNLQRKGDEPIPPAPLYVISDLPKNLKSNVTAGSKESDVSNKMPLGFPEGFFTQIVHLEAMPISKFLTQQTEINEDIHLSKVALQFNHHGDLQKLQNLDVVPGISSADEIFISVRENWNFEAVNKLPWKLHNLGLTPYFLDANRNLIWQKEWKIFKRLNIKGVVMPVNLLEYGRSLKKRPNSLKTMFGGGSENSLSQLTAVYLSEVQICPPYYIYESEIATWNASVLDGSVKLVF